MLCHDSPKALSADIVKSLGQIDVSGIQVGVLFLTLLLQLTSSEHRVDCSAILPEGPLTLRQEAITKVLNETVRTRANVLPAKDRREIPRWLSQACLFPFRL